MSNAAKVLNSNQLKTEASPNLNTTVAYPLRDEKGTSFPPPLAIDVSVVTDRQKPLTIVSENGSVSDSRRVSRTRKASDESTRKIFSYRNNLEKIVPSKIGEEKQNGAERSEERVQPPTIQYGVCNSETCLKMPYETQICNTSYTKRTDSNDNINPAKLTQIINNSIKEAIETIVKQCSMEDKQLCSSTLKKGEESSDENDERRCRCSGDIPMRINNDRHAREEDRRHSNMTRKNRDEDIKEEQQLCSSTLKKRKESSDETDEHRRRYSADIPMRIKNDHHTREEKDRRHSKMSRNNRDEDIKVNNFSSRFNQSIVPRAENAVREAWLANKIDNTRIEEKKSKKRSRSHKSVIKDSRRMTGNVNIYICSESNENAQTHVEDKQKSKSPPCTESSSETTTQKSNGTFDPAASVSLSKLANDTQRKRRESEAQRAPSASREKSESGDDNSEASIGSNGYTLEYGDSRMAAEQDSKDLLGPYERSTCDLDFVDTKFATISGDGRCCDDPTFSGSDVRDDASDSSRSRSRFTARDRFEQSGTTIFPSTAASSPVESDTRLRRSICTNVGYQPARSSDRNDGIEFWNGRTSKKQRESANVCRCRFERARSSIASYDEWRKRDNNGKREERSRGEGHRENGSQQWSTCACIAEEDEDYCEDCNVPERFTVCGTILDCPSRPVERILHDFSSEGPERQPEKDYGPETGATLKDEMLKDERRDTPVISDVPDRRPSDGRKSRVGEKVRTVHHTGRPQERVKVTLIQKKILKKLRTQNKGTQSPAAQRILADPVRSSAPTRTSAIAKDDVGVAKAGLEDGSAPAQIRNNTRAAMKDSTPIAIKGNTPAQVQNSTLTEVKVGAPTQVKDSTPAQLKDSTPTQVKNNTPAQVKNSIPTQVKDSTPTQVTNSTPAQVKNSKPTQVKDSTPTQVKDSTPAQVKDSTPTQVKNSTPTQVKDSTPTQVKDSTPRRSTDQNNGMKNKISRFMPKFALLSPEVPKQEKESMSTPDASKEPITPPRKKTKSFSEPTRQENGEHSTVKTDEQSSKSDAEVATKAEPKKLLLQRVFKKPLNIITRNNKANTHEIAKNNVTVDKDNEDMSVEKVATSQDTKSDKKKSIVEELKILPSSSSSADKGSTQRVSTLAKDNVAQKETPQTQLSMPEGNNGQKRKPSDSKSNDVGPSQKLVSADKPSGRLSQAQPVLSNKNATETKESINNSKDTSPAAPVQLTESESKDVTKVVKGKSDAQPERIDEKINEISDVHQQDVIETNYSTCHSTTCPKEFVSADIDNHRNCCLQTKTSGCCGSTKRDPVNVERARAESKGADFTVSKAKCRCTFTHAARVDHRRPEDERRCKKSMICLYCEKPRERCSCRGPVRKCSICEFAVDICDCEDARSRRFNGRPVVVERGNDQTMRVTAWKPRREVRRYFARDVEDDRSDRAEECRCREKRKPCGSGELPYQRIGAFSDVLDELQQKMSESVSHTARRASPFYRKSRIDRMEEKGGRYRRMEYPEMERSKSKALNNCKCNVCSSRNDQKRTVPPTLVCYSCDATPCICKNGRSNQSGPRAKCYYCKSSPCNCIVTSTLISPRPCRCGDSTCKTRKKKITPRGNQSTDRKDNKEKLPYARNGNNHTVPRRYQCYKNGGKMFQVDERCR